MPRIQPFTPLLSALANPFCSFRFALFISRMQAMRGGLESCSVLGCGNTGPGACEPCKPAPGCKRAVKPVCAWRPIPVSWLLFLYGQVLDRLWTGSYAAWPASVAATRRLKGVRRWAACRAASRSSRAGAESVVYRRAMRPVISYSGRVASMWRRS